MRRDGNAAALSLETSARQMELAAQAVAEVEEPWRRTMRRVLDGPPVTILMAVATVYALFGDDIRLTAFEPEEDIAFEVMSSTVFFMFIVEIIANAVAKPEYIALPDWRPENLSWRRCHKLLLLGSFYFWLDAIATVSLISEVRCWRSGPRPPPAAHLGRRFPGSSRRTSRTRPLRPRSGRR